MKPPEVLTGVEIVAGDLFPSVANNLRASWRDHGQGCGPGRYVLARRAPELVAVLRVKGSHELLRVDIALENDFAFVQDRRTAETPFGVFRCVPAGLHAAQVFVPKLLAGHVEREETLGGEQCYDVLAIRGRS